MNAVLSALPGSIEDFSFKINEGQNTMKRLKKIIKEKNMAKKGNKKKMLNGLMDLSSR